MTRLARQLAALVVPEVIATLEGARLELAYFAEAPGELDGTTLEAIDSEYRKAEGLGFALGCLGAACGANLLLARRAPAGPASLARILAKALAKRGVELASRTGGDPFTGLPSWRPSVGEGWELPVLVGAMLLAAADEPNTSRVQWQLTEHDGEARFSVTPLPPDRTPLDMSTREIAQRGLPELRFAGGALIFPSAWSEPS